jgi:hypothetical protein
LKDLEHLIFHFNRENAMDTQGKRRSQAHSNEAKENYYILPSEPEEVYFCASEDFCPLMERDPEHCRECPFYQQIGLSF